MEEDKEWILKYLSTGKDVVPYEMITRFDSLDIFLLKKAVFSCHTNFI